LIKLQLLVMLLKGIKCNINKNYRDCFTWNNDVCPMGMQGGSAKRINVFDSFCWPSLYPYWAYIVVWSVSRPRRHLLMTKRSKRLFWLIDWLIAFLCLCAFTTMYLSIVLFCQFTWNTFNYEITLCNCKEFYLTTFGFFYCSQYSE